MQPQLQESEHKHVSAMLKTQAGVYWFSGDNWIEVWKDGSGTLLEMPEEYRKNTYQIGDIIEHNGAICIATRGGGIYIYDDNDDKSRWQHLSHQDGMPAVDINALLSASDGTLWAGLYSGGVMSYKNGRWVKYNASDGAPETTVISLYEDQSGVIWIFNADSITKFQPERQAPQVVIEAGSENVYPNDSAVFSVQGRDAWNETLQDELVYSWRVVNESDRQPLGDWSAYSPQTLVNTQRMQPGAYRFEVRAQDKSRNTSVTPAVAMFTVAPYFWTTPAFLVPVMTSVFIAIISLLIWYRNYIKLQHSEERYRRWLDKEAVTLVLNWDESGTLTYFNEAAKTFYNPIQADFQQSPVASWISEDEEQQERFQQVVQSAVSHPQTQQNCQIQTKRAGKDHWVSWFIRAAKNKSSHRHEILAIGVDITEQRIAESALMQEILSFQEFCDRAQVGILRVDKQENIVYMNPAMKELIEADSSPITDWHKWAETAVWKSFVWSIHDDDEPMHGMLKGKKIQSTQPFYAFVSGIRKKDYIELIVLDYTEQKELQNKLAAMSRYEQEKLGRELHDGLGQMLSSIFYMNERVRMKDYESEQDFQNIFVSMHALLHQAIGQTRLVSMGLHPVKMGEFGLKSALEDLLDSYRQIYHSGIELQYDDHFQIHNDEEADILYRLLREAVFNALKHADASLISVALYQTEDSRTVCIQDNGKGINSSHPHQHGMGMNIMESLAEQLGGKLVVESIQGQETRIICTIPTNMTFEKKEQHVLQANL